MSGPKVVRIVTREEMIAACQAFLARLDAAAGEWERIGRRNGTVSGEDVQELDARRERLRSLLSSDRFADLQKQVAAEISYLASDTQSRLTRAAQAEVERRNGIRRLRKSAETLVLALQRSGREAPPALVGTLNSRSASRAEIETAIGIALQLLPATGRSDELTDRQYKIARQLGQNERRATLSDWLASQSPGDDDGLLHDVDKHLADLSALAGPESVSAFQAHCELIESEPSLQRKRLLADSLVLDITSATKKAKERTVLHSELVTLRQELARYEHQDARAAVTRLDATLHSLDFSAAPALLAQGKAILEREAASHASLARRRVILAGLADLGYEVREGMETAWVENGRVVMRKAASPDYGVEIGGNPDGRLQMRTVAFGGLETPRDARHDIEMETAWCGDFSRLRSIVADQGGEIFVDKALDVGVVPLRVVTETVGDEAAEVKVDQQLAR